MNRKIDFLYRTWMILAILTILLNTNPAYSQVYLMTPGGSSSTCSGNFYDSGNIGGTYGDSENATHTICPSTPGAMLQVTFTAFDIEDNYDNFTIYNGPSTASPLIGSYTGTTLLGTVTSSDPSGCLTFEFTSDGSVTNSGWEASLSCISSGPIIITPGGSISTCSGNFYDSGDISGPYANNENATFTISSITPGAILQAMFTAFELEPNYDSLTIYDGPTTSFPLIGSYTGNTSPGIVSSTGQSGSLTFVFTSNGANTYSGWEASLSCISPIIMTSGGSSDACLGNFYDSGNIGGTYADNENATHTICPSTPGSTLQATFTSFDLETNYDSLTIYDGPTTTSPLIGSFTGTINPGTFTSTHPSGCLTFVFISDWSVNNAGWELSLECVPSPSCDNDQIAPIADIASLTTVSGYCSVFPVPPTATDYCIGTIIGIPDVMFPITSIGITTITWTYDDGNGNVSTQLQNVYIGELNATVIQYDALLTTNIVSTSYQWIDCNNGNAIIPGAQSQSFIPADSGNYAVIVTESSCTDTSDCFLFEYDGIEENFSDVNFTIQPNPGNGLFNILINGMKSNNAIVSISNALGQIVYTTSINTGLEEFKMTIDLSAHESGIYFVNIHCENGTALMKRIVKQ